MLKKKYIYFFKSNISYNFYTKKKKKKKPLFQT